MPSEIRIVHAADIHLDSPLRGLNRLGDPALVERLRRATGDAFRAMVDWCLQHRPAAVVLAGDIYDGDLQDYTTGRFFVRQLGRLHDCAIPVFIVHGNHDAASVVTRTLRHPPNTHVLATDQPESVVLDHVGLAVHGQGFATRAVAKNLAVDYPVALRGLINVGLLHTSVAGYEGHDPYAPCSVDDLTARGYEYFALGHIHQRETLSEGLHTVAFSGNLQGRHIKETGPKGFSVVTLRPEQPAVIEFQECDVARWAHTDIDLSTGEDWDACLDSIATQITQVSNDADGRPLVLRMTLRGATPAAAQFADREKVENEVGVICERAGVTLEKVVRSVSLPAKQQPLPPAELERLLALAVPQVLDDDARKDLKALLDEARPELSKLGIDLTLEERQLLASARDALLARLGGL